MLGAELALRGHRVALIDRDQGQHLTRIWPVYPLEIYGLELGDQDHADIRIIDTAPEVDSARALGYLREADYALIPVKGPEAAAC
jgi:cellulose biosynthesis protein BcsQ